MRLFLLAGLAAGSLFFVVSECGAQSLPPGYPYAPPAVSYVPAPPPAEIVEMQPPPPDGRPYWHWQRGHWRWDGRQYVWHPGHWIERPPHMAEWIAPHWEQHPNGWFMVEGRWRAEGESMPAYERGRREEHEHNPMYDRR